MFDKTIIYSRRVEVGMSKFRFAFLLQHLQFDDMDTKQERQEVKQLEIYSNCSLKNANLRTHLSNISLSMKSWRHSAKVLGSDNIFG